MPDTLLLQWLADLAMLVSLFGACFLVSTLLIRWGIPKLKTGPLPESAQAGQLPKSAQAGQLPESSSSAIFDLRSTGFWIGLCETFLIFVLVFASEFGALAIIIGAKEFTRAEKIRENPSYYLLGTLANLCVAILFALVAQRLTVSF